MYGQKNYIYTVELSQQATENEPEIATKNPAWEPGQPLAYVGIHAKSPLTLFDGDDFSASGRSLVKKFGQRLLMDYYTSKTDRWAVLRAEEHFILELRGRGFGVVTRRQQRDNYVYVVELAPEAVTDENAPAEGASTQSTELPPVYVGMTCKDPEERFEQHKAGGRKASKKVEEFGIRLRPDLYEGLNEMTEREALRMERALASRLERIGFHVEGGT